MIKVTNINKSFNHGAVKVLHDLSLTIDDGQFVVILGASGSGKSTALNIMAGLERPDRGTVLYDDQDIYQLNDRALTKFRRQNVGFVWQRYYLLPHLTVAQNVKLGADLASNRDYPAIIAAVGLTDKLNSKPYTLSGGEQQRVCLARALAKKPKVLFLDEPTGALDEETGRNVLAYVLELQRTLGLTMIMVTHNQNIAETANTVIKMNSGKIVGTYHNAHPKSAREIGW